MIYILSTDTPHHRYFINRILDSGIDIGKVYFETTSVKPKFQTGPFYKKETEDYEEANFFKDVSRDISRFKIVESENINDKLIYDDLVKEGSPDLGIVFGTRLIKKHIIDCFATGLINVHRGIAQEYRGLDSDLWAIYHKDFKNIGCTIHFVDSRLDTGNVVDQNTIVLTGDMKIYQIRYYTTVLATDMVISSIKKYLAGELTSNKQTKEGRYYSFMPIDLKIDAALKFNNYVSKL